MKILKFGGSSLGSKQGLENAQRVILDGLRDNSKLAVVVSAFGKTTDKLISLSQLAVNQKDSLKVDLNHLEDEHRQLCAHFVKPQHIDGALSDIQQLFEELRKVLQGVALVGDLSRKTLDYIMSFGERASALTFAQILRSQHLDTFYLDARQIIRTDDTFGAAVVNWQETEGRIKDYFSHNPGVHIVTGFIASTADDSTTTLGRGGSDYTASLLGAALDADEVQIWTDVSGIMTADPRRVPSAYPIQRLSYEEALELSHFGAKVIYPPTMQPAIERQIPIRIKNTFEPDAPGTLISNEQSQSRSAVTGIASISEIALCRLQGTGLVGVAGIASRLFKALAEKQINIILISQASSEHSICFAISPGHAKLAKQTVESEFRFEIQAGVVDRLTVESNMSVVAAVGDQMRQVPGVSARLFSSLGRNGINVIAIAQGSSERNISVAINSKDETKALNALHDAFFLSDVKTLNLFVVGTGSVGSVLINQIKSHQGALLENQKLALKVHGISNSRQMVVSERAIPLSSWDSELEAGATAHLEQFLSQMKALNLPNSVFVDCTASQAVASTYCDLLKSSISVITPNKRANSGSWQDYVELKQHAKRSNVKYFYETNVGAGLPIIWTLNDLLNSGDRIYKIEAVLSGTLSYIFNTFTPDKKFSEVVLEAKRLGYTEPDPRDDLSGMDVCRKLLILAREMGLTLEEKDIQVESLVSVKGQNASTIEEFLECLVEEDDSFADRQNAAIAAGKRLRYIGIIENSEAYVALEAVDFDHPFYSLSGSDNIISFTTERYLERPLVVKGPGAGTAVTAAGVLADIVKLSSYLE